MELRVLRYFLTVAQEGNITKSAESLHMTQPTLSRQLMQLEEELGVTLFERGKRQVVLTDDGVLFHQRAKEVISLVDKIVQEFAEQKDSVGGTVFIGSVESTSAFIIPEMLRQFSERYPMVQYDIYSGYADDIKEKLDKGLLDIGILVEPVETSKYDYVRLPQKEHWGILVRQDDPISERSYITLSEIKDKQLIVPKRTAIRSELSNWFGVDYEELHVYATYNLLSNASLLVEHGLGYAVCLHGAFFSREDTNTRFIPFEPARESGSVLVWRKNQIFSVATSLFIQAAKAMVRPED